MLKAYELYESGRSREPENVTVRFMASPGDDPRLVRPNRRQVVKGLAWASPGVAIASAAPAYAVSRGCDDIFHDLYSSLSTTLLPRPTREKPVDMGRETHGRYDPGTWLSVTSILTFRGPEVLPSGGTLEIAIDGDGRNEYWGEIVSVGGAAAAKLSDPTTTSTTNWWRASWTIDDDLVNGDQIIVGWRMSGAEAVDPERQTVVRSKFGYPPDTYCGIDSSITPWIGASADGTGTPDFPFYIPRTFYGFVTAVLESECDEWDPNCW